ncbi:lactate utilization protein C [Vibrio hangzhouensis]|uniref:LutC/YkgG family protein n=1 Tax=Vibrio hangzhouensis TaxID=462991 RepID=UPI001C97C7D0|nr:lactate utilization protein C [Vibrio hangzhouensis]MBY6196152.1 lactate utilization protein C [Vibrio hangzhouensis]
MNTRLAKDNILGRLKQAKRTPKTAEEMAFFPWGSHSEITQDDKAKRFVEMMTANHADVRITTRAKLTTEITSVINHYQFEQIAIGTAGEYINNFEAATNAFQVTAFNEEIENWKSELFNHIDVGITHTLGGIADTGALVLWPSEHEPRTLSLVPPSHIAVVKKSALYGHFLQVMQDNKWNHYMPTNALLISGPSKTADIQQTLAYGAHGPSQLIVLLVEDE